MRFCLLMWCAIGLTFAQNEQDIAEGKALFRSNCAFCHGLTGAGGRGPALISGRLLHGSTDEDIKRVILKGVPGTTMPAFSRMDKDELNRLVAFVRTLSGSAGNAVPLRGNAQRGKAVYDRQGCGGCHRVGGKGSIFGPDLTRVGAGRSLEYLRESIVNPSSDIPEEYHGVTVVEHGGKRVSGVRINEDTFSVQLRDMSQGFRLYDKSKLQSVAHETKSLMPAYKLSPADLDDLVAYLVGLRGALETGGQTRRSEEIH